MGEDEAAGSAEAVSAFEPLTAPGPLSREELDDEDLELWIVRVPQQMNAEQLQHCKLPLTEGRVSRSDTAELTAETFIPHGLHLLLPNRKGKKLKTVSAPLAGQIMVHQRLDVSSADADTTPVTSLLPRPPEIRRDRHPLLGIGYKKTLKRNSKALALSDALDSSLSGGSPEKRRKSETASSDSTPKSGKRKKQKTT